MKRFFQRSKEKQQTDIPDRPKPKRLWLFAAIAAVILAAAVAVILLCSRNVLSRGTRYRYSIRAKDNTVTVTIKGKFEPDCWRDEADSGLLTLTQTTDQQNKTVYQLSAEENGNYTATFTYYDNSYSIRVQILVAQGSAAVTEHLALDYQMTPLQGQNDDFAYTITRSAAGVSVVLDKIAEAPPSGGEDEFVVMGESSLLSVQHDISQATNRRERFLFTADEPLEETVLIARKGQTTALQLDFSMGEDDVLTVTDAAAVEYSYPEDTDTSQEVPFASQQEDEETMQEDNHSEGGTDNAGGTS